MQVRKSFPKIIKHDYIWQWSLHNFLPVHAMYYCFKTEAESAFCGVFLRLLRTTKESTCVHHLVLIILNCGVSTQGKDVTLYALHVNH